MGNFASWLFAPSGLSAHGFCLLWRPGLIYTHALSDLLIGCAYFGISATLAVFAHRRGDLAFRPLFWLFATFIMLCGLSHWADALTLWVPVYGAQAVVKVATALASLLTLAALVRILPQALAVPSPAQYRQTLDALRTSEAFLERASSAAGIGVWEFDLGGRTLTLSAETCRIHGVPPGFSPTLAEALNFYAPPSRPLLKAAMEGCVAGAPGFDLELAFVRADASQIWVRTVGTLLHESGRPVRISGVVHDITKAVTQRRALEEANERVTLATEIGGFGIWEWDILNDRLIWSDRMYQLHDLPREPPITTPASSWAHIHPADLKRFGAWAKEAIDGMAPSETEIRVIWTDGSLHYLRTVARVKLDHDRRVVRMIGLCWDVTQARLHALGPADDHAAELPISLSPAVGRKQDAAEPAPPTLPASPD